VGTVVSLHVLASGIDTLYWSSACGIAEERSAAFRAARERAGECGEVVEVGGHTLVLESHGAGKYPILLTSPELSVQLTDSRHLPTALVQLRSEFLHDEGGPRGAYGGSIAVVEALCQREVSAPKTSRLDVYADVADWVLADSDRRGLVTHAKLRPVLRAGTEEYETIQVGKQPGALLRLYRKDIKERSTPGFADVFWGGHAGPVVRVEVEAGSKKLRDVGIVSVDDALSCFGELWKYGTEQFCRLHVPGAGDREGWPLDDRWAALQQLAFGAFPCCDMAPLIKAERSQERIARGLLGSLASWAAVEGVFDSREALFWLRGRYPDLVADPRRSFAAEVAKRHVRLPRAVRKRHIG
jgi:hypothetical protein